MSDTVLGLPIHPLVVHAVVVLAPLLVVMLAAFAMSERFRAWSGWLTPALGAVTTASAFVASSTGESLEHALPHTAAIEEHAQLGDVLPWVVLATTVVAAALWWAWRRDRGPAADRADLRAGGDPGTTRRPALFRALAVVGVLAALGLGVDVTLVGHSGAAAAWGDVGTSANAQAGDGG